MYLPYRFAVSDSSRSHPFFRGPLHFSTRVFASPSHSAGVHFWTNGHFCLLPRDTYLPCFLSTRNTFLCQRLLPLHSIAALNIRVPSVHNLRCHLSFVFQTHLSVNQSHLPMCQFSWSRTYFIQWTSDFDPVPYVCLFVALSPLALVPLPPLCAVRDCFLVWLLAPSYNHTPFWLSRLMPSRLFDFLSPWCRQGFDRAHQVSSSHSCTPDPPLQLRCRDLFSTFFKCGPPEHMRASASALAKTFQESRSDGESS